jgi:hypothetical protein
MTTPIVRGFGERLFVVRDAKGELAWTLDEREARAEAAKPGCRLAEYAFIRELRLDRAAANEAPPWEDLPPEAEGAVT